LQLRRNDIKSGEGEKPFKKKTEQVTNENCNHNHHVCIFSHDACSFPLGNAVIPLFRFLLSKNRDYMLLHIMICQVVLIEHHQLMGAGGWENVSGRVLRKVGCDFVRSSLWQKETLNFRSLSNFMNDSSPPWGSLREAPNQTLKTPSSTKLADWRHHLTYDPAAAQRKALQLIQFSGKDNDDREARP
jgi:hypothetical protein